MNKLVMEKMPRFAERPARILATLRDTLLPKLLSGELSVAGGSYSKLSNNSKPTETNP